jgi:hypothetical protein
MRCVGLGALRTLVSALLFPVAQRDRAQGDDHSSGVLRGLAARLWCEIWVRVKSSLT